MKEGAENVEAVFSKPLAFVTPDGLFVAIEMGDKATVGKMIEAGVDLFSCKIKQSSTQLLSKRINYLFI